MTVHCLNPHTADMPEVDHVDWWTPVVQCPDCRQSFAVEDGVLVPVTETESVAEAIANEERTGWDGARLRLLSEDPHWAGVLDGPG